MDIKGVVFFDLDGTLLNDKSKVDKEVTDAITKLKNNGILPVICTGRSTHEIKHVQEITGINTIITLNGSLIKIDDKIIYQKVIPISICSKILDLADSLDESLSMYNNKTIKTNGKINDEIIAAHKLIAEPIPEPDSSFYKNNNVNMIVVYTSKNVKLYEEQFSNDIKFYKTSNFSIDGIMKSESKKEGIIKLLDNLNLNSIPTYAFGDGPNDVEMLDYVDNSVVMENARNDIFEHGDFITSKNTDHGIVNGLRHFNLI